MRKTIALLVPLTLMGCGSTKMLSENHFEITTVYWNFKPRSTFQMQDGQLTKEIRLYDSKGRVELLYTVKGDFDFSLLNYRSGADSSRADRDFEKLNRGTNEFAKHVGINYRPMLEKGVFDISFTLLIWLNEVGKAEHAICIRNIKCPPEVIKSVIDEAEAWQFPVDKGKRLKCFQRTFNFHVLHHNDYAL